MANPIWIGKRKRKEPAPPERAAPAEPGRAPSALEQRRRTELDNEHAMIRPTPVEPEPHDPSRPRPHPFSAEIDLTELDGRFRPGLSWTGRAVEISGSHLAFRSRRMCYDGRRILVAVHLIDSVPVALYGEVVNCEYDGEGLYRTELALLNVPELDVISNWIASRGARGAM